MNQIENVTFFDHPLLQHKISMLRDENTGTNEFRKLVEEIAMLMGYEALRDLPFILETPNDAAGYAKEIALLREKRN